MKRTLPRLPLPLRRQVCLGSHITPPPLRERYLDCLTVPQQPAEFGTAGEAYTFTFLNESRELELPITWNSPNYSRLWQFNLHYFDWVRNILATAYQEQQLNSYNLSKLKHLISDWIAANPLGRFDGWHPYTTSLRLVNWTFLARAILSLAEPEFLASLWLQLSYLHRNKEYFAGGNHLLENLRGLIVGGLNFTGKSAEEIVQVALDELGQQLAIQVLPDGGHYERSPMYHLIVLNLVAESVACLKSAGWAVPERVLEPLRRMLTFAVNMRLANGTYPLWNDAAYNVAEPLDEVVSWIGQLLGQPATHPTDALHKRLLQASGISPIAPTPESSTNASSSSFPDSGYYILRNARGLELAFDCAPPCPDELPPHAHADCLTADLYYQGQAVIVDTGTSQYAGGEIRDRERSTLAHNTVAIANQNQSEIWGSFRVGRKAQPFAICSGHLPGWQWVTAAHNGYARPPLNAVHRRWIGLASETIVILDRLETALSTEYTSSIHFAPGLDLSFHPDTATYSCKLGATSVYFTVLGLEDRDEIHWFNSDTGKSWYAPEFGLRIPRGVLQIQGPLSPSGKTICMVLTLDSSPKVSFEWLGTQGTLDFQGNSCLQWHLEQESLIAQISRARENAT